MGKRKGRRSDTKGKPRADRWDVAHTAVGATISAIPIIGGPAEKLFTAAIGPPLVRRYGKWIESIDDRLTQVEKRIDGFRVEDLSKDDVFITTMMYASQIAIRSHQEEKLDALRNAVLNSALKRAPDEDLQLMFLNFVDGFTAWHMRILKFLDDPLAWILKAGLPQPKFFQLGSSALLEYAFPELKERRDFYDQLVKDLFSRGLIDIEQLHIMMSMQDASLSRTTPLGKQLINFITSPPEH